MVDKLEFLRSDAATKNGQQMFITVVKQELCMWLCRGFWMLHTVT